MRWIAFLRGALRQLPVETVLVAAAAIGAIGLDHDSHGVWAARLVLAALVATPLAFAAHRLAPFGRWLPVLVGGLAAAGVLAAVTAAIDEQRDVDRAAFGWPYLLSLVAAVLLPFIIPGPGFARFVRRFFEQTTLWAVLCGAALGALRILQLAVEELFEVRLRHAWTDAGIVIGCCFVLIYLHRLRSDDRGRMPELWRRLATMIGAPFVSAMLAILVVYEVSARARGELPRNMLSPLIMAAGLAGFVSTLIISAVLDEPTGSGPLVPAVAQRWAQTWSVRLTRAFPALLLALLPMAGWALAIRIGQHGLTPFRALREMALTCLAVLGVLGSVRWWRCLPPLSWQVPATIAGFALAAAFGPLGVVSRSIDSQAARAAQLLDAAGIARSVPPVEFTLEPREIYEATPARHVELAPVDFDALRGALQDLAHLGGEPAVRKVLGGSLGHCGARGWVDECLAQLGVSARNLTQVERPAWQ